MNTAYVYLQLYRLFDSKTPVPADCGKLCGKRCCKGDDAGMFLFPGEAEVYKLLSPNWINIESSDFKYTYDGKIYRLPLATCSGSCDRYQRPLSCRIFPLTPILENSRLCIITDPRAYHMCPLAKAMLIDDFDRRFIKNIYRAFSLLMQNKQFAAFMEVYSEYINEFKKFY